LVLGVARLGNLQAGPHPNAVQPACGAGPRESCHVGHRPNRATSAIVPIVPRRPSSQSRAPSVHAARSRRPAALSPSVARRKPSVAPPRWQKRPGSCA